LCPYRLTVYLSIVMDTLSIPNAGVGANSQYCPVNHRRDGADVHAQL
jgi:hypothetical protein